ncbi:Phosphoglucosamine mutase [Acidisarcina polymorpha]|uniref:Phosphoglucosamine mutase n=1 Tax=Acidisarcina polymorpha TaxID=2211140 RepID=A0A2Z5G9M5_9BACT|nr:phosphoglucomutase/phosphomannomutase family protein [Acidisarcina polymorpha]AXC15275.1 Phosphoglucosamine mutase [Acidisarcina polymorpha]
MASSTQILGSHSAETQPPATPIKFGTDGWRGVIAEDFTFENVRIAAAAIGSYILEKEDASKGICIGYDTRFASRDFAMAAAKVLAAMGIAVSLADRYTPTPALSYAVLHRGAAGGIMITSSHNPAQWNGVKYKAAYGGSGSPAIMTEIASYLGKPIRPVAEPAAITEVDFQTPYVHAISNFADLALIAKSGLKFAVDCMYGSGRGVIAGILEPLGVDLVEIRGEVNPLFPGINPEPIEPHIRALEDTVVAEQCQAGLATDGDADRLGAVDEHGNFVDPHKIFSILLRWLLERKKWPGDVTRAFNTTSMIDRICAKHGRKLYEHGIGFKFVADLMLEPDKDILIGGEESGGIGIKRHLPERDGLLNCLLLANIMAEEKQTLGQLVASLQAEYGEHQYGRIDLHIDDAIKNAAIARALAGVDSIAGMKVLRTSTLDGVKFFLDNPEARGKSNPAETWLLLRASGTEPLLRVYSESCSTESVSRVLQAGKDFVLSSKP